MQWFTNGACNITKTSVSLIFKRNIIELYPDRQRFELYVKHLHAWMPHPQYDRSPCNIPRSILHYPVPRIHITEFEKIQTIIYSTDFGHFMF